MRLTRRGYGVVALVVVGEVLAVTYGARALNAVVAPALIALVGAVVQVRRSPSPSVERAPVAPGFPGDDRQVTLDVDGGGIVRIEEAVPAGVTADPPSRDASLPDRSTGRGETSGTVTAEARAPTTFSYAVRLTDRGEHTLGPVDVWVRDVLGLVERHHGTGLTTDVLVYPPVYHLAGGAAVFDHVLDRTEVERQEFDALREYAPGDPLRDVHWKSTAKDPDEIYVTEFADRRPEEGVVVAASSEDGHADEMAAAAASVAVMALDAGVGVELRTPSGTVPHGRGPDHRDRLLRVLALTDGGRVATSRTGGGGGGGEEGGEGGPGPTAGAESTNGDVDVSVHANADGVTITLGTQSRALTDMTVSRENPLVDREVGA